MDDLPVKVTKLPQINGRIHEWCYFQPYEIEEIAPILKNITPIFENIDIKKPKDFEIVECIYELCGGYLGFIIPFLQKVERYLLFEPQEISIMYLRAVFLRTQIDKNTSINKSMEIHSGKPIVKTSIKKNRSKRRSKL